MLIPSDERQIIYDKFFNLLLDMRIVSIPTPLRLICYHLNIEIDTLSKITARTSQSEAEILEVWRNDDGCLENDYKNNSFKIVYNDSPKKRLRKNFTIAEELAHYILGHYTSPIYKISHEDWQKEDFEEYKYHEECARIGAGILVCPPPVFYELDDAYGFSESEIGIAYIFDISKECAKARINILKTFEKEIKRASKYEDLLEHYEKTAFYFHCERCGETPITLYDIRRNNSLCHACEAELYADLCGYYIWG